MRHRKRIKLTGDWDQLVPLFEWPEQEEYERIRQPVLFGSPVPERAKETGVPERTLFSTKGAKRQLLAPVIRRMIVDLKAEHPAFNDSEITNIVYVRTGRRLEDHTAAHVLSEEVVPLKLSRLFEPCSRLFEPYQ